MWGTDANGNDVPVAWVGGMTHAQGERGSRRVRGGDGKIEREEREERETNNIFI